MNESGENLVSYISPVRVFSNVEKGARLQWTSCPEKDNVKLTSSCL